MVLQCQNVQNFKRSNSYDCDLAKQSKLERGVLSNEEAESIYGVKMMVYNGQTKMWETSTIKSTFMTVNNMKQHSEDIMWNFVENVGILLYVVLLRRKIMLIVSQK